MLKQMNSGVRGPTRTVPAPDLEAFFPEVSPEALERLRGMLIPREYESGSVLYTEGRLCPGVFLLTSGRIELSISSSNGKRVAVHLAEPGEVLGLSCVISTEPCATTARASGRTEALFVTRMDFASLLQGFPEVYIQLIPLLTQQVDRVNNKLKVLREPRHGSKAALAALPTA